MCIKLKPISKTCLGIFKNRHTKQNEQILYNSIYEWLTDCIMGQSACNEINLSTGYALPSLIFTHSLLSSFFSFTLLTRININVTFSKQLLRTSKQLLRSCWRLWQDWNFLCKNKRKKYVLKFLCNKINYRSTYNILYCTAKSLGLNAFKSKQSIMYQSLFQFPIYCVGFACKTWMLMYHNFLRRTRDIFSQNPT